MAKSPEVRFFLGDNPPTLDELTEQRRKENLAVHEKAEADANRDLSEADRKLVKSMDVPAHTFLLALFDVIRGQTNPHS